MESPTVSHAFRLAAATEGHWSPCVSIIGPGAASHSLLESLTVGGRVVDMPALAHADQDSIAGITVATLACDAVIAVIPATVGLDPGTAAVWQTAADRGMPRAVVVSELGLHNAGFEDLVAIATRGLAEECVPIRLPVFDDDMWGDEADSAVLSIPRFASEREVSAVVDPLTASLSLLSGVLSSVHGESPAEFGHMHVSEDARTALVEAAASCCDDAAYSASLLAALRVEADSDALRVGAGVRLLAPGPGLSAGESQPVAVWDITPTVVSAASTGHFVPATVHVPAGTAAADLWRLWSQLAAQLLLVRRDIDGEPTSGFAAVVLAVAGSQAVVREVFPGHTNSGTWQVGTAQPVLITRPGWTADQHLAPDRAWPGLLSVQEQLTDGSEADTQEVADQPGRCWLVTSTPPLAVGDAIVSEHKWVVPEVQL